MGRRFQLLIQLFLVMQRKAVSLREHKPDSELGTEGFGAGGWARPEEHCAAGRFDPELSRGAGAVRDLELGRRADAAWREARKARAQAWIRRAGWSAMAVRNALGVLFCLGWVCFAGLTLMDSSIPEGVLRGQYRAVWGWLLLVLMTFPIVSAVGGWAAEWCGKGVQHGLRWIARRRHIDV